MGCDIHCYIEYREKDVVNKSWSDFGGRINPGRNYGLFRLMAGVRSYSSVGVLFEPKGLPEDLAYSANHDNFLYITDDEKCSCGESNSASSKSAKMWVEGGSSVYKKDREGKPTWVSNPDLHSHSWLSLAEYSQVLEAYKGVEQKDWERREEERLKLIETFKERNPDLDLKEDSWLYEPCGHYDEPEYHAILAAMKSFEAMGYESRLVFWFDN